METHVSSVPVFTDVTSYTSTLHIWRVYSWILKPGKGFMKRHRKRNSERKQVWYKLIMYVDLVWSTRCKDLAMTLFILGQFFAYCSFVY
jgi:hypothetical protein